MWAQWVLLVPFLVYGFWGFRVCVLHVHMCRDFRNALDGPKHQGQKCRVENESQDCYICIFLCLKIQSSSSPLKTIYHLV